MCCNPVLDKPFMTSILDIQAYHTILCECLHFYLDDNQYSMQVNAQMKK